MAQGLSPQLKRKVAEDACCGKHLEPPLLFCEGDRVTLCDKCLLSEEHKNQLVCGIEVAAENYRKLFQELLNRLKEKLEVAKSLLSEERERMVTVQGEEQNFKEVITSEYTTMFRLLTEKNEPNFRKLQGCIFSSNLREADFSQLMTFATELEEKFQETLQRLNRLERENMNKLQESEIRLSEQIRVLQRITADLEEKCREPTLALLKGLQNCLEWTDGTLLLPCLEPAQITDPSLSQIPEMRKMLEVLQRPITLDPQTAHPYLVLSEDLRSVRLRNVQQNVSGNPGRFDFSISVLGMERFTSGRHYWEVDVEKATKWQLGICEDPASPKGVMPKASRDKFLLTGSMMGTDYTFWVFPPLKRVCLGEQMHKVGIFLDYKYGQVTFYDVTKRLLIYNFSHLVFQGALRPIFSLCFPNGGTNADTLCICLPSDSSCNVTVSPQPSLVGDIKAQDAQMSRA